MLNSLSFLLFRIRQREKAKMLTISKGSLLKYFKFKRNKNLDENLLQDLKQQMGKAPRLLECNSDSGLSLKCCGEKGPTLPSGMSEDARTLPSLLGSEDWLPAAVTGDQQVLGVLMNLRRHFCRYMYRGMLVVAPSSLDLGSLPQAPQEKSGLSIFVPFQVPMLCSHQNACELCTISRHHLFKFKT